MNAAEHAERRRFSVVLLKVFRDFAVCFLFLLLLFWMATVLPSPQHEQAEDCVRLMVFLTVINAAIASGITRRQAFWLLCLPACFFGWHAYYQIAAWWQWLPALAVILAGITYLSHEAYYYPHGRQRRQRQPLQPNQ